MSIVRRILATASLLFVILLCALTATPETAPTAPIPATVGTHITPPSTTAPTVPTAPSTAPTPVDPCIAAAAELYRTQDYTGTDIQVECFGEEDSARTGLALDYGTTVEQYAVNERGDTVRLYDV